MSVTNLSGLRHKVLFRREAFESEFDSCWFSCCLSSLSPNRTSDNNGRQNAYVCSAREAGRASKWSPDFAMTLAVFRCPGEAVCMPLSTPKSSNAVLSLSTRPSSTHTIHHALAHTYYTLLRRAGRDAHAGQRRRPSRMHPVQLDRVCHGRRGQVSSNHPTCGHVSPL